MGNTFARLCISFIKHLFVAETTHATQTMTRFTEKLTNFGTVDLGSSESFDQACNICDLYTEKEAAGFCCHCEQYLCYQCCKHHEKISLSQNHTIVGKEDFDKVAKEISLFEMCLVPLMTKYLPRCIHGSGKCPGFRYCYDHETKVLAIFSQQDSREICFLMSTNSYNANDIQLGVITHDATYKTIAPSKNVMTINATIRYFVFKGNNIWLTKYSNEKFSTKILFSTTDACYGVVPFDNGLAVSIYIQTGFTLPDWQIQYLDFKGNIKKQIYYDSNGKPLFKSPHHLASNETEDILFVSDSRNNTVIALDPKGNVFYKFTHDSIQSPTGLTCDEENNVYIACKKKVIQIDKHGKQCRTILESKYNDITNLYYDKFQRRLAVIEASRSVSIFAFLP